MLEIATPYKFRVEITYFGMPDEYRLGPVVRKNFYAAGGEETDNQYDAGNDLRTLNYEFDTRNDRDAGIANLRAALGEHFDEVTLTVPIDREVAESVMVQRHGRVFYLVPDPRLWMTFTYNDDTLSDGVVQAALNEIAVNFFGDCVDTRRNTDTGKRETVFKFPTEGACAAADYMFQAVKMLNFSPYKDNQPASLAVTYDNTALDFRYDVAIISAAAREGGLFSSSCQDDDGCRFVQIDFNSLDDCVKARSAIVAALGEVGDYSIVGD